LPGSQNRINRISAPGQLGEDRRAAGQRAQLGPARTVQRLHLRTAPSEQLFSQRHYPWLTPGRPTPQVAGSSTPHSPRAAPQSRVDNKSGGRNSRPGRHVTTHRWCVRVPRAATHLPSRNTVRLEPRRATRREATAHQRLALRPAESAPRASALFYPPGQSGSGPAHAGGGQHVGRGRQAVLGAGPGDRGGAHRAGQPDRFGRRHPRGGGHA